MEIKNIYVWLVRYEMVIYWKWEKEKKEKMVKKKLFYL